MPQRITPAQALEVGRRLNPTARTIRFRADGTVVQPVALTEEWAGIELWECWREAGVVRVAKLADPAATKG